MIILYKNRNFIFKRAFIYIALFIFINNLSFCSIISDVQSKCIWVSEKNLIDSLKIESLINFSKVNDLNKIFFKIRNNGDAFYQSNLVYRNEMLDSLFDPLDYLISS